MKDYEIFLELEIIEDADRDEIDSINDYLIHRFPSEDFCMYDSNCHDTSYGWTLGITANGTDDLIRLSEEHPNLTFSLRILDVCGLSVEQIRAGQSV